MGGGGATVRLPLFASVRCKRTGKNIVPLGKGASGKKRTSNARGGKKRELVFLSKGKKKWGPSFGQAPIDYSEEKVIKRKKWPSKKRSRREKIRNPAVVVGG